MTLSKDKHDLQLGNQKVILNHLAFLSFKFPSFKMLFLSSTFVVTAGSVRSLMSSPNLYLQLRTELLLELDRLGALRYGSGMAELAEEQKRLLREKSNCYMCIYIYMYIYISLFDHILSVCIYI